MPIDSAKTATRGTGRRPPALFGVVALLAVLTVLSCGGCAYFKDWQQLPKSKSDELTIYVVSHGWHTGIVVNRTQLGEHLQFIPQELGESAYYEFGWGEKEFYQAADNSVWLALKATLWVNDSTMHVVALPSPANEYFPDSETVELKISSNGHRTLTKAIAVSFAKDSDGKVRSTRDGLYGKSRFFDAEGYYHAFNNCNTWTARTLGEAGVPMTEILTLTAGSAMRQSRWAAKKYRCCAESPNEDDP